MNKLRYLMIIVIFLLGLISLSSCQDNSNTVEADFPDESGKYLQFAQKYCADNNLTIDKYLGRTIIRFKDYKAGVKQKEPVVYEWQVTNKASKDKYVIGVGPIMPMFPNNNPPVLLTKGRYEFNKTMKIK